MLVHCSDGWDRTAQTCSLSSLMLDPYYRTVQGYQALIEKEWLGFGHKFTDRCRLISVVSCYIVEYHWKAIDDFIISESSWCFFQVDNKEESPVFTQFLDATWQMMCQFPTAFQFNERFLLVLHDHLFSSQYGTFLGNCEKDRVDLRYMPMDYDSC